MAQEFPPLKNDLFLRAARGEQTERAPVWVMRQAGRYLPEFRKLRESHDFFEICRTPALATEITLQPIRRYTSLLDAAIIFSDILVIPQAMGLVVEMNPAPFFPEPLQSPEDLKRLKEHVDVGKELGYVYEAITQTRHSLQGEVPLIGFVGAPWTLMAYMIEGGGNKTLQKAKTWIFKYPEISTILLRRIADVCADHLVGQVKAGAQAVQVFDTWAGELSLHDFATFSLPSLTHVSARFRSKLSELGLPTVPMILFPKGANTSFAAIAEHSGYDVIGIDWVADPSEVRRILNAYSPRPLAIQGNMDPSLLYGGKDAIEQAVLRMCKSFLGPEHMPSRWIANLGHGIMPGVDPEDLRWFLECVHKYSRCT